MVKKVPDSTQSTRIKVYIIYNYMVLFDCCALLHLDLRVRVTSVLNHFTVDVRDFSKRAPES